MKKILLTTVILFFRTTQLTIAYNFAERRFPRQTYSSGTTMVLDRLEGIIIIKPSSRSRQFDNEGSSAQLLGSGEGEGDIVLNASYFRYNAGKYFPAGHVAYDQALIDPNLCLHDKNLCGYILLDTLQIKEGLTITTEPTITAGPVLISKGEIRPEISHRYSHRQHRTTRTVLINTSKGNFFVITKKQYTLPQLSAYLLKTFGKKTTAINLDGGSSSTLWTKYPLFQIGPRKILPTFFVLK